MHIDIASIFCVVYNKYTERIGSFSAIRHMYSATNTTTRCLYEREYVFKIHYDESTNTKYDISCVCVDGMYNLMSDVQFFAVTPMAHKRRRATEKKSWNIFAWKMYSIVLRSRNQMNKKNLFVMHELRRSVHAHTYISYWIFFRS